MTFGEPVKVVRQTVYKPMEALQTRYSALIMEAGLFQRITKTYINSDFDIVPSVHFRNKFELSYNIPKNPITPSVSFEAFSPLNGYAPEAFDELRIKTEIQFPLKNKQSITGGIMYVHEQFETQISGIMFLFSYKISIG